MEKITTLPQAIRIVPLATILLLHSLYTLAEVSVGNEIWQSRNLPKKTAPAGDTVIKAHRKAVTAPGVGKSIAIPANKSIAKRNTVKLSPLEKQSVAVQQVVADFSDDQVYRELMARAAKDTLVNPRLKGKLFENQARLLQYSNETLLDALVFLRPQPFTIYEEDNRMEIDNLRADPRYKKVAEKRVQNAKSVLVMLSSSMIEHNNDGTFSFKSAPETFSSRMKVCGKERFSDQLSIGNCTAFAVSENRIISAGHCITQETRKDYVLIFDFLFNSIYQKDKRFPNDLLVYPKEVKNGTGADFSIIIPGQPIPRSRLVEIDTHSKFTKNDLFYVIGSPCGIPLKYADDAHLLSNDSKNSYFSLNCDTYGGNSGSPVFLARTEKVVGILVTGDQDFFFVKTEECYRSVERRKGTGRGEDITRISLINQ